MIIESLTQSIIVHNPGHLLSSFNLSHCSTDIIMWLDIFNTYKLAILGFI